MEELGGKGEPNVIAFPLDSARDARLENIPGGVEAYAKSIIDVFKAEPTCAPDAIAKAKGAYVLTLKSDYARMLADTFRQYGTKLDSIPVQYRQYNVTVASLYLDELAREKIANSAFLETK